MANDFGIPPKFIITGDIDAAAEAIPTLKSKFRMFNDPRQKGDLDVARQTATIGTASAEMTSTHGIHTIRLNAEAPQVNFPAICPDQIYVANGIYLNSIKVFMSLTGQNGSGVWTSISPALDPIPVLPGSWHQGITASLDMERQTLYLLYYTNVFDDPLYTITAYLASSAYPFDSWGLSTNLGAYYPYGMKIDDRGTIHMLLHSEPTGETSTLYYGYKPRDGAVSIVEVYHIDDYSSFWGDLYVDYDYSCHATYFGKNASNYTELHYVKLDSGAISVNEVVYTAPITSAVIVDARITADGDLIPHIIYGLTSGAYIELYYTKKDGSWSAPDNMGTQAAHMNFALNAAGLFDFDMFGGSPDALYLVAKSGDEDTEGGLWETWYDGGWQRQHISEYQPGVYIDKIRVESWVNSSVDALYAAVWHKHNDTPSAHGEDIASFFKLGYLSVVGEYAAWEFTEITGASANDPAGLSLEITGIGI